MINVNYMGNALVLLMIYKGWLENMVNTNNVAKVLNGLKRIKKTMIYNLKNDVWQVRPGYRNNSP